MLVFLFVVFGILGLLFGSFLDVVALRFNTGKSLNGRSQCFSCAHTLSWYELIPVVSWTIQRGRCRNCSSRIPPHILTELAGGIVFAGIAMRGVLSAGLTALEIMNVPYMLATAYLLTLSCILFVILFYDIRHKIIPDRLSLTFGILAFVGMFFFGFQGGVFTFVGFHIPQLWHMLAGVLVPLPFVILWLISKGSWIGLGDPKLMVGIAFVLGLSQGFSSVLLAFWIGTLFALSVWIVNLILKKQLLHQGKHSIMKSEVPFAPFLIIAFWVTLIINVNFFMFA